ncbi:MAG: protoheme IX farnesyltransferase, partial [Porticoccaceae bacterium]
LMVITTLPYLTGMFGLLYLVGSLLLGGRFLYWAIFMWLDKDSGMKTFKFSIIYLMVLFALMLLDHYLIDKVLYI